MNTRYKKSSTPRIKWSLTADDQVQVERIVERIKSKWLQDDSPDKGPFDKKQWLMDITACHLNGTPLDLKKLADADEFTFFHDVYGIARHMNRRTGKLEHFFLPRTHKGETQ